MKKNILTKMLCAALMVSLTVPDLTAIAARDGLPQMETREGVYVGDGEGDSGIMPYFGPGGHVKRQCAYVASHLKLSAQQQAILETSARDADQLYSKVKGFHARKGTNYLAHLKALEFCSVRIDKVSDLKSYVLERLPKISETDATDVGQMIDAILYYVEEEKNYATREQKRYAIAGFGVHLLGDMFAHRTMIKKVWLDSWDKKDTDTVKYFHSEDFKDETVEDFKAKIRAGKLCTVDMRPYMKEPSGATYIDNIKFMPGRIKAAERAAASFVETVFVKGLTFSDINYYLTEYNLQLENFAQYKATV